METLETKIPFNYRTIRVTEGRIRKGLLAIPLSLIGLFPEKKGKIHVWLGVSERISPKNFTPYTSSSRECRIGGMRGFYEKFKVKGGEEVVVQVLPDNTYRIIPEKQFKDLVRKLEGEFDLSTQESKAGSTLEQISQITASGLKEVASSEYYRLCGAPVGRRSFGLRRPAHGRGTVPASIRRLLEDLCEGKCQISGFTFAMRDGRPYFEVHHIKGEWGDHPKNLLVVSPNVHAQFTYAPVRHFFDGNGWLRRVRFNDQEFAVYQVIDRIAKRFSKEVHLEP